jgi:hypothetical protein
MAFCIFLIRSEFYFALAAPVAPAAIGEMLDVRSNTVDALKREIAVWETQKRMGSDDEQTDLSTNDMYQKFRSKNYQAPGDAKPDEPYVYNSDDIKGYNSEEMLGWESPWDAEVMGSDARGPDAYYNNPKEDSFSDEEDSHPAKRPKPSDGNDGNESGGEDNGVYGKLPVDESGYNGDDESSSDHSELSGEGSTGPEPEPEPESEHSATPEHTTPEYMVDLEKLFRPRRRNSGSGVWCCGYAKEATKISGDRH